MTIQIVDDVILDLELSEEAMEMICAHMKNYEFNTTSEAINDLVIRGLKKKGYW
jgi:hypothetical protein